MIIENIRYDIISRGKNQPEKLPAAGEIFCLHIQSLNPDTLIQIESIASISAEHVEHLGPYSHVIGDAMVKEENSLPCDAKYAINGEFAQGFPIGELILKKAIEEL